MNKKIALSFIFSMNFGLMIGMTPGEIAFMNKLYLKQKPHKNNMSSFYYRYGENVFFEAEEELSKKREAFDKSIQKKMKPEEEKFSNQYMQTPKPSLKTISSYFSSFSSSPRSGKTTPETISPEANYYQRR